MNYLYRHFDSQGKLLYVGVSLSFLQRLGQHKENSHWFSLISRVEIESFPSRSEALSAERQAIRSEDPAYNVQRYSLPCSGRSFTMALPMSEHGTLWHASHNEFYVPCPFHQQDVTGLDFESSILVDEDDDKFFWICFACGLHGTAKRIKKINHEDHIVIFTVNYIESCCNKHSTLYSKIIFIRNRLHGLPDSVNISLRAYKESLEYKAMFKKSA